MFASVRTKKLWIMGFAVLMIVFALALTACSSQPAQVQTNESPEATTQEAGAPDQASEELPNVIFQAFPADPAAIPLLIMQNESMDESCGFKSELLTVDPDAAMNTFLIGESDIATEQDIVTTAIARQEGHETVTFYPVLEMMTGIVVPEDSPYQNPEDLVGKKVGHFGIDSGTTTGIALMLDELYGVNVYEDYDLREVGPEALPELLASGEVEAIFDFQPLLVRAVQITPGRYLFHPYTAWAERTGGWAPWLTNLVAKKEWIRENPDLAIAIRDCWAEAQQEIIDSNYELLGQDPYASFLELRDEQELRGFIDYCQNEVPCYASSWTKEDLAHAEEWVRLMAEHKLLVEEVPEEPVAVILEEFLGR
jgi:NitT/TauT family transport system substrate-binding protein